MRGKTAIGLLCCLLAFILTLPVQSQATPTPGPCGLPSNRQTWRTSTTQKIWNMTTDCTFSTSNVYYIRVESGAFTVNGYTIYADDGAEAFTVASGGTLNLNNVTIRGLDESARYAIGVQGRLNATDVTLTNNETNATINVAGSGARADLTNMRFLNNTSGGLSGNTSALAVASGSTANLSGAIFTGNTLAGYVVRVASSATLNITGCLTMSGNTGINLGTQSGGTINNNSVGTCAGGGFATVTPTPRPRKKQKESQLPPTPTATPRPAYGASYVALQTETGMTFEAAYGLDSGVHFRQLDGAGIGIQSIIDAGPLAALDVYGYVEQGVEVCFPQIGRVVFLDARTMPRAIMDLDATVRDGMTCVFLNSPGSLALLPN